ncbi:acyl carrier protein [Candidatus Pelagibacter sp.]|nr:acyl carrier protein [Candidatus Pelagibacter sp.]
MKNVNKTYIINEINEIINKIIKNKDILLTEKTKAIDIDGYDSLIHIKLIVSIEKKFKIRFNTSDINNFRNFSDIIKIVQTLTK